MTTIAELSPGDIVANFGTSATFIAHTPHPLWPQFRLVIWRAADGTWHHDAHDIHQDVGQVQPADATARTAQLRRALLGEGEPSPQRRAVEPSTVEPRVVPNIIKAGGVTVTYDGKELTIKHIGYRVTTSVSQIIGVELQEPAGIRFGKFQVKTTGGISKGLLPPKDPWTVSFSVGMASFRALYDDLNSKINR